MDGIIKLVFVLAIGGNLGPVDAVAMTINPANIIFGFENEDSPLVDGETVDLEQVGSSEDFGDDLVSLVWFRKITIGENVLGREDFLKTKNQAMFGGSELCGVGRDDFGAANGKNAYITIHVFIKA